MSLSISSINRIYAVNPASFPTVSDSLAYRQPSAQQSNASSSLYDQFVKSAATGIAGFLNAAKDVQSTAKSLVNKGESGFPARIATSSDEKKVTASASAGATNKSYEVKVDSLASSQTNSGTLLSKADPSAVNSGTNQLKITIGGKSTTVSANVSSSDSNDQALAKLRDAINGAKTGVTASVVTDKESGLKKLELKSDKTGTDQKFEVADVVGNAVAATGIGATTVAASNAAYSVNGGATQSSQSNTIELEKGKVTAKLVAPTTDAAVTIGVRPDADQALKQVKELISSYNAVRERGKEAGGYLNSSILRNLDSVVNSTGLKDLGISRNGDGSLKLDEEKFKKSLSTDYERTAKAISGKNGLADRLSSAVDRYNQVPASSLLNPKAQQMQQFLQYQSLMFQPPTSYAFPFASSGLLLNGYM